MSPTTPPAHPFERRRARVLEALGPHAAMVLPAAPEIVVGRDVELRYVPDPELLYLTGYRQPEAIAVLCPAADEPFTLFVRDRDPAREVWTGPREDVRAAGERVGADAAWPVHELDERLPALLAPADRVYFRLGAGDGHAESLLLELLRKGRSRRQRAGAGLAELADPGLILDELRLVKDDAEIAALRTAVDLSVQGFRAALAAVRPGAGEWAIEAALEAEFRRAGADGPAFTTIAASGPNATVLHYTANDRVMKAGELLLLDGGARVGGYNGDLTRTVPVDGRLQGPARDVWHAVHEANRAAIAAARPGRPVSDIHDAALDILLPAMIDLGLADGDPDELRADEDAWKPFYPHNTSHWLGLDVHDVGTYTHRDGPRTLEPGMVLTIEPGLYIPADDPDAPPHLRGIGVRIEDDVLITDAGPDVLSAGLPA